MSCSEALEAGVLGSLFIYGFLVISKLGRLVYIFFFNSCIFYFFTAVNSSGHSGGHGRGSLGL